MTIREVSGLGTYIRYAPTQPFARRELAVRIATLQAGDHSARWNGPSSHEPWKPDVGHGQGLAGARSFLAAGFVVDTAFLQRIYVPIVIAGVVGPRR